MTSVSIAVFGEALVPPAQAAVRVHGVYDTMTEARDAVRDLASEHSDIDAYIIDETARWISVRPPTKNTAEEDEEIASKCNEAPSKGRMGSVCDILRPSTVTTPGGEATSSATDAAPPAAVVIPPTARKEVGTVQQRQLDDLLELTVPVDVMSEGDYARLRGRYATLTAFRRKLRALHTAGEEKCRKTESEIAARDASHPTHRTAFRSHYERGLRESGYTVDAVPFLAHLGGDEDIC